ncbi:MAG: type II toxin-antitoxin system VapC family toxin [archaeon GB-1867-005]|nr:type II toxin-antitoxin system VapC family toxin [Candidatus Culexmicrobium cathedralense]
MERAKVVVDASVICKWFVEEDYSREAGLLRDAYASGLIDVVVPSLVYYEVLNALKYSGEFGEDELKEVARILEDCQFTEFSLKGGVALKAVEIAMRKGLTLYDASYAALAYELNAVLYTADEKLIGKIDDPERVRHIRRFRVSP